MEMKLQLFGEPLDYRLLVDEEEPLFLAAEEEEEDEPAGDGDGDGIGGPDDGDAEDEEIVADADEAEKAAIFFPRLKAVDSNLPHTEFGKMLVADEDGNLLAVEADADGTVREEYVLIEDENVMDGTLSGGKLQESTITSRELDMTEIFADSALIKQLLAENMDAAALFENEEFGERYDERYWKNFAGAELAETDLNEVTTPGRYYSATGENVENKPVEENGFLLDVLRTGEGALQQEFRTGKEIYARDGMEVQEAVEDSEESEEIERSGVYEWKVWTRRNLSPVDLTGETVDFNDFTFANGYTDGQWKSRYDSGTERMTNIPHNRAFVMELTAPRQASKSDYIMRMRIMYGFDKSVHERWCESGVWSAWKEYSKNGVAASAAKLETARTIAITDGATGTATAFDGTGNIKIPVTGLDVSKANAGLLAIGRGGTGGESRAEAWNNIVAAGGTFTGHITVPTVIYFSGFSGASLSVESSSRMNLTAQFSGGNMTSLRVNPGGYEIASNALTLRRDVGGTESYGAVLTTLWTQDELWNRVVAGGGTLTAPLQLAYRSDALVSADASGIAMNQYGNIKFKDTAAASANWSVAAKDGTAMLRVYNNKDRAVSPVQINGYDVVSGQNLLTKSWEVTVPELVYGASFEKVIQFGKTFERTPAGVIVCWGSSDSHYYNIESFGATTTTFTLRVTNIINSLIPTKTRWVRGIVSLI